MNEKGHLLSNKLYDVLKLCALIIFPALGTLYMALAAIWGFPAADEVFKTIIAVDTFLGVVVKIGDASYNASEARFDGAMVIEDKHTGGKIYNLELKDDARQLAEKDEVIFKVRKEAA